MTANVENLRERELQNGINQLASYQPFGDQVKEVKRKLLAQLKTDDLERALAEAESELELAQLDLEAQLDWASLWAGGA